MWKIFKRYGCQPITISKHIRLKRREKSVMARAAFNLGNTTDDIVSVNEINPVPVEEAEYVEKTNKNK